MLAAVCDEEWQALKKIAKVLSIVLLFSKYSRALTSQNLCQVDADLDQRLERRRRWQQVKKRPTIVSKET